MMAMNDAKTFLQQIRLLETKINNKQAEKQRLRDRLYRTTPTLKPNAGTGSGSSDKLGDTTARIVDIEAEIRKYEAEKAYIVSVLNKIPNPDQLAVLHNRYVLYKSFKQISIDLQMPQRTVFETHRKGLQAVDEILKGDRK